MDGTDGGAGGDDDWLFETLRSVVRATTGRTDPAAIADGVTDALGEADGFAWIGHPGERPGTVRVLAASGDFDSPLLLSVEREHSTSDSATATTRALREGDQQFDSLAENREYQLLRSEQAIPEAATGLSVPLGDGADGYGVLHWYGHRDLTTAVVRDTVAELAALTTDALRAADTRQELARERERLESLRSTLSHDLGNPLNLGAGRLNLARDDCDSEHLDHVERAFEQIDDLVDEGLTFVQAGKPVAEPERLSVQDVAETCWEHVDADRASLSVPALTVSADPERLRRLLNELFENAVVHSDGEVTVRIEPLEAGGFAVVDDGPAIPEKHQEYVFDRGYTTASDRAGEGLAVVQEVASAHGWAVSLGDADAGTRVEIRTGPW